MLNFILSILNLATCSSDSLMMTLLNRCPIIHTQPYYAVSNNTVFDHHLEEFTLDEDVMNFENIDLVDLLNGTISFPRSQRLENSNNNPLIEFV